MILFWEGLILKKFALLLPTEPNILETNVYYRQIIEYLLHYSECLFLFQPKSTRLLETNKRVLSTLKFMRLFQPVMLACF
jgi:hypothetical protein